MYDYSLNVNGKWDIFNVYTGQLYGVVLTKEEAVAGVAYLEGKS